MSLFNRRNALLGWTVWQFGKRMAKKKAKDAVPKIDAEAKRPNKPAIVASLLAISAGLMFWRKKSSSDGDSPPA
jgi:hypothetical protein